MKLFSKKTSFVIGSLVGSVAGLLFAREAGKNLREKIRVAKTPQNKFEVIFKEYLKVGKAVFGEVKESDLAHDIVKGGRDILAELKKKARTKGTAAVKLAEKKTAALIADAEAHARSFDVKKSLVGTRKIVRKVSSAAARKIKTVKRRVKKMR